MLFCWGNSKDDRCPFPAINFFLSFGYPFSLSFFLCETKNRERKGSQKMKENRRGRRHSAGAHQRQLNIGEKQRTLFSPISCVVGAGAVSSSCSTSKDWWPDHCFQAYFLPREAVIKVGHQIFKEVEHCSGPSRITFILQRYPCALPTYVY